MSVPGGVDEEDEGPNCPSKAGKRAEQWPGDTMKTPRTKCQNQDQRAPATTINKLQQTRMEAGGIGQGQRSSRGEGGAGGYTGPGGSMERLSGPGWVAGVVDDISPRRGGLRKSREKEKEVMVRKAEDGENQDRTR